MEINCFYWCFQLETSGSKFVSKVLYFQQKRYFTANPERTMPLMTRTTQSQNRKNHSGQMLKSPKRFIQLQWNSSWWIFRSCLDRQQGVLFGSYAQFTSGNSEKTNLERQLVDFLLELLTITSGLFFQHFLAKHNTLFFAQGSLQLIPVYQTQKDTCPSRLMFAQLVHTNQRIYIFLPVMGISS